MEIVIDKRYIYIYIHLFPVALWFEVVGRQIFQCFLLRIADSTQAVLAVRAKESRGREMTSMPACHVSRDFLRLLSLCLAWSSSWHHESWRQWNAMVTRRVTTVDVCSLPRTQRTGSGFSKGWWLSCGAYEHRNFFLFDETFGNTFFLVEIVDLSGNVTMSMAHVTMSLALVQDFRNPKFQSLAEAVACSLHL